MNSLPMYIPARKNKKSDSGRVRTCALSDSGLNAAP